MPGYVPTPLIKAVIEEATQDWEDTLIPTTEALGMYSNNDCHRATPTTVRQQLAWACGVSNRTIYAILEEERETILTRTADKIICGLGLQHRWFNDERLRAYY